MINRRVFSTVSGLLLVLCTPAFVQGRTFRVSTTPGSVDPDTCGDTWATACSLDCAVTKASAGDSIWVKAGTYYRGDEDVGPVKLNWGVKLIGGFDDNASLASQSNPDLNLTILHGGRSAAEPAPWGRVVEASGCDDPYDPANYPLLRGFRIANGYCAQQMEFEAGGGGMLLDNSCARIVQCEFVNNLATWAGAGVSIKGEEGAPWFINCTFWDNGSETPNTDFDVDVTPLAGGAVIVWSGAPTFVNCLFYNNLAGEAGAIYCDPSASFTLENCTFVKNKAKISFAGAISDEGGGGSARNCIFWDNTVPPGRTGSQIGSDPGHPTVVTYSDVQGGWPGSMNIDADPLFVNATNNNYRLGTNSPCIDKGRSFSPGLPEDHGDLNWNENLTEATPLDLDLLTRRVNIKVDLGPYERPAGPPGTQYEP